MSKILQHNLDGTSTFIDTRTLQEAHEENLLRIRERVTHLIDAAGYDATWQQNAALGVIDAEEVLQGRQFIAAMRGAYADYKARLLASSRDEADSVAFVEPPVPVATTTAEQIVSKYFSPYQIQALARLEMALLQANKPLGPAMSAAKTWLESVMLGWAINPVPAPAAAFGEPSVTFEQASAEAVAGLQSGQNPET